MACFHREGNEPVTMEAFNIHVRWVTITGEESFKKHKGMPSEAYAEVFLKNFIFNIIVLLSVGCGAVSETCCLLKYSLVSLWSDKCCRDFSNVCFQKFAKKLVNSFTVFCSFSPVSSGHAYFAVAGMSCLRVFYKAAVCPLLLLSFLVEIIWFTLIK